MSSRPDRIDTSSRILSGFREIEKWHPHKMLSYLILLGSFLVLMFLLITFTIEAVNYHELLTTLKLPKFFIIGTIVILISGLFRNDLLTFYGIDDIEAIRKKIFEKFLFGSVFLLFQFVGWLELVFQGIAFKNDIIGTFLFLITGYQMLHVISSLMYIAIFLYRSRDIQVDPVSKLLYFTSPYERIKLEIFGTFWNFIGISWIFLFVWLVFLI
jgi:cytochrome c oxidase subunit III